MLGICVEVLENKAILSAGDAMMLTVLRRIYRKKLLFVIEPEVAKTLIGDRAQQATGGIISLVLSRIDVAISPDHGEYLQVGTPRIGLCKVFIQRMIRIEDFKGIAG